ncbi:MAG: hemolysin III family protein [Clostridiales Family XIII bacterium]|jgi:hemolysin III|nr:hemolysin III family protein [Clostridiales Family XIII bacterium]
MNTLTPLKKAIFNIKQYTVGEEVFNSVSHGVGALLGLIGGTVAVTIAVMHGNTREIAATLIYALTLVILYTMSTLYHAFPWPRVKSVFRIFDHSSVFLLIAGTFTPFTLITLQDSWKGLAVFIGIWAVAIIGITLNAINIQKFAKLSVVLYLLMGYSIFLIIREIIAELSMGGFWLLMAGGACYTIGVVFYIIKKVRYFHSIWHLFVVAGSILHYLCIVLYVL